MVRESALSGVGSSFSVDFTLVLGRLPLVEDFPLPQIFVKYGHE